MLFDEKDLNVFHSVESREYFKEVLQSYYSRNYRATIVMLYSFVIYDLLTKLQTMANEGDKKAIREIVSINEMIGDDEKYSKIENQIIGFYKENSPLYFDKFVEDVEYLKKCRNKCAHLKINDNSLYVPNDYHARMLICSMYDNVLSVKAPFIMDLFPLAKSDVEEYSSRITYISNEGLDTAINQNIKNKYLKRMTYDAIKKSYSTFIKLLFVLNNEDSEKNALGLYAFIYAMTEYIIEQGFLQIFQEDSIIDMFNKIDKELLQNSSPRRKAVISIIMQFPITIDYLISKNKLLFDFISRIILLDPEGICKYRSFYPRSEKSVYEFFKENKELKQPLYTEKLYTCLQVAEDFDINEFMKIMVKEIPSFNGFSRADAFMESLKLHIEELDINELDEIITVYNSNLQCTNRSRHEADMELIKDYIIQYND